MQNLSVNFILGTDALYWALGILFASIATLILFLKSGGGYSVEDTQAHSTDYGGVIREGHGGMTAFLWSFYIFMLGWTIFYFVQHASEFAIIFAGGE